MVSKIATHQPNANVGSPEISPNENSSPSRITTPAQTATQSPRLIEWTKAPLDEPTPNTRLDRIKTSIEESFDSTKGKVKAVCLRNNRPTKAAKVIACTVLSAGAGFGFGVGFVALIAGLGMLAIGASSSFIAASVGLAGVSTGTGCSATAGIFGFFESTRRVRSDSDKDNTLSKLGYALKHGDTTYAKARIRELGTVHNNKNDPEALSKSINRILSDVHHGLDNSKNLKQNQKSSSVLTVMMTSLTQFKEHLDSDLLETKAEALSEIADKLQSNSEDVLANQVRALLIA